MLLSEKLRYGLSDDHTAHREIQKLYSQRYTDPLMRPGMVEFRIPLFRCDSYSAASLQSIGKQRANLDELDNQWNQHPSAAEMRRQDRNDPKSMLASPNHTANLSGLVVGSIEADV